MRHGEGIHRRVVIDEIRSPQLDDLPQLTVEIITKQGRQRCVFLENGSCRRLIIRNHIILKCLNPLITIDVLVIHMIHVEAAFFIDIDDCAALVIFAVAPAVRSPSSGHRRAASRRALPDYLGCLHFDSYSRFPQKLTNIMIWEKNGEYVG